MYRRFLQVGQFSSLTQPMRATYIPELYPSDKIWMVDLALRVDMLARAHHHGRGWGDIYKRCLSGICVRHPYRHGKAVCAAAEVDRKGAGQVNEKGTRAIWKRCTGQRIFSRSQVMLLGSHARDSGQGWHTMYIGSWRERGISCEGLGHIVVGSVNIVIFLMNEIQHKFS
jgi:hypothetical protein